MEVILGQNGRFVTKKWDTSSVKRQLERTRSSKNFKEPSGKSLVKLDRTEQSWTEPSEVGKNPAKLESSS